MDNIDEPLKISVNQGRSVKSQRYSITIYTVK
jgi:hypothetical protein